MSFDLTNNPTMPLTVGFVVSFLASIYPISLHKKINENGVWLVFPHVHQYVIPGYLSAVVSALVHVSGRTYPATLREPNEQAKWQILGYLLSTGLGLCMGLFVHVFYRVISYFAKKDENFDDKNIYDELPNSNNKIE
jgi:hypothetical protein